MKVLAVGLVYWNPFSRRDPSLVTFVAIAQRIDGNHFHCAAVVLVWFESSEAKVWDWEHAPGIQNMFSEVALAFPINHYGREMEKWRRDHHFLSRTKSFSLHFLVQPSPTCKRAQQLPTLLAQQC